MEDVVKQQEVGAEIVTNPIKEEVSNLKIGVCRILSTKNNTIIHVTDMTGSVTYAKISGGSKVKAKKDEGSAYAAFLVAREAAELALRKGINCCHF
ncbi:RS14, partial [Hepatospora eriocheir]